MAPDDRLDTLMTNSETFIEIANELITLLGLMDAKLDIIVEAATAEPGESPLPGLLQRLVQAIEDQTEMLRALPAQVVRAMTTGEC